MLKTILTILTFLFTIHMACAQQGVDTIHYRKVYYFAGTGLALPLGKTKDVFAPKLFAGSMGLDVSLKNPKYYLSPTLYMFNFDYNQLKDDPEYNYPIESGNASVYMLSLSAGARKQINRLNTYVYLGPSLGLVNEPRAKLSNNVIKIYDKKFFAVGAKIGVGADYKFKSFFLGSEIGYMQHFTQIQGKSFQALTILVGLKSDITRLSEKVVDIVSSE